MRIVFAIFLVAHGLIHLLGAVKAFRVVDVPQLTLPIDRPLGVLWLLAAAMLFVTAIVFFTWPQWVVGGGRRRYRPIAGRDRDVLGRCPLWDDRECHCARGRCARLPLTRSDQFSRGVRPGGCAGAGSSGRNTATRRSRSRTAADGGAAVHPPQRSGGPAARAELPSI